MNRIEKKILKNKQKAVDLLNENLFLNHKLLVSKMKRTYDLDVNLGSKKNPDMKTVTFGCWDEIFRDEDTKEGITIERKIPIFVEGKPSDRYKVIELLTIDDLY